MPIVNVTLEDVLRAHDTRADAQRRLLRTYRLPLVSFTMNIAGPVKSSPLIALAFDTGLEALYDALGQPMAAEIIRPATGCEALLVYDRPAAELKAACLALETATPVGRLYDLDVLDTDGDKLSRLVQRTCLICGGPVTVCSRSRAHGLDAIVNRTREILMDFAAGYLAGLAAKALTEEVRLTPKPGLIDERNNGAHSDMDLPLFLRSIDALTPWLRRITALSLSGADAAALQAAGLEAEAAMFRATGGVNTHKGALFSFSVLLAALAAWKNGVGELLAPLVAVIKAVPVASFIILALVWLNSRSLSLFISALMVFPPVYLNVLEGIRRTDGQLLEMARVFRVPFSRQLRYIYLPQIMPYFRTAVSLGLGLCWKAGAAAEVIGLPAGSVGERLYTAKVYFQTPDLFAWTVTIVAVSVLFERLFLILTDWAARKVGG